MIRDILTKLVAMRTPSDDAAANQQALNYVGDFLVARGMYAYDFTFEGHPALIATPRPNLKTPTVMLYVHTDVLPAADHMFTLQQDGDTLRGRGTYDMKFAIAAYMQLIDDIQHELANYDFAIMLTSDEEYGGLDGISSVPHFTRAGYIPKVCVMPDGGQNWQLERLAKGLWRFNLEATGKTAHGARPWEGDSASFKLIHALHDLKAMFDGHGPETDTLNIGIIEGGVAFNQVPDEMKAAVEIRLASEDALSRNMERVENIRKKYGLQVKTRAITEPTIQTVEEPLLLAFQQSIERIAGVPPQTCISFGQSDAVYFNAVGVPCILTRPVGGGPHSNTEWISLASLLQMPDILKDYLRRVASASSRNSSLVTSSPEKHHI